MGFATMGLSSPDCYAIRHLLTVCGDYARQQSYMGFQVFEKGLDDYVTTVDRALDAKLLAGFQALFPQDGIITEENRATVHQLQAPQRRLWFIDPIDGTDDFIHGRADYAVMVGQLVDGHPQAGWIYAPAHGKLYWGGQGQGLFWQGADGTPHRLPPVNPPLISGQRWNLVIGTPDRRRFGADLMAQLPGVSFVSLGSFGLKVLQVITGNAGLYIYLNGRVKLWDTVGPLALAHAAGLVCCDLAGNPLQFTEPHVDGETVAHRQPIVVGWPQYVEAFRPTIQRVVAAAQTVA
ncbi:MAG: 3'(2'),5'-bisphosphate nucleotidase CysQ [Spirulina sp.]